MRKGPQTTMAQKIVLTSDLSGESSSVSTVTYSWDGHNYEIDLTEKEKAEMAKVLKKYLDQSRVLVTTKRPVGRPPGSKNGTGVKRGPGRPRSSGKVEARPARSVVDPSPATIRAWAQAHNVDVPSRGRIPEPVLLKFQAAQG